MPMISQYDSAAFMHRATAHFLRGKDFDIRKNVPRGVPKPVFMGLIRSLNELAGTAEN